MSISDSSQWSDLSAISRISRSSSIRPLARFDSVVNISECPASSSFHEIATKSAANTADGQSDLSKATKMVVACEESIGEYARIKFLYDCLRETTMKKDSAVLEKSTIEKLKGILAMHTANKFLQLPNVNNYHSEDLTLLGITDLPKIHPTHDERRDIATAVENILRERLNNFIIRYETLGGTIKEILKAQESLGKAYLMDNPCGDSLRWKEQIDKICAEYHRDLLNCADLLIERQRLKYYEMKKINLRNAESLLLKAQVAEAQVKITTRMCALRMFKETPKTVDAYRILNTIVDDSLDKVREELRAKKALKVAYADVSSSAYDELLTKYTKLCNAIKKQERLMEML